MYLTAAIECNTNLNTTVLKLAGAATAGNGIPRFTYSSAMAEYAEELKACYKELPVVHRTYNLARKSDKINCVVNKRVIFQSSAYNRLQHLIVEASSITPAEVLNCDIGTECILLEGEPCVGKTQLLWELCCQKDEIPAVKKYQLIIMLDLKCKHAQDIGSLEELLTHHTSYNPIQHDLIQEVQDAKGKNILIIMDGFEQLPHVITKNHESFIVKVIEGKILPKSTKLITATPSVTRSIIVRYNLTRVRHIQLLGFLSEHVDKFTQCVPQEDNVQSLMHLPLNASIIAKFHQKCVHRSQQTLTQYYSLYCLDLIQDYLKTTSPEVATCYMQHLSDLHPQVYSKLVLLSKIALIETISKEIAYQNIFTKDFVHLGLMFPSHFCRDVEETEFKFLNYMLQAFLAAFYISQQDEYEQDRIFFNHSLSELSSVWRFVSGLCGLTPTVLEVLKSKSSVNDLYHLPFIVGLLYEQQDETVIKGVFGSEVITYSLSYPEGSHDLMYRCYSLGYCIAASNCSWNLNFSSCDIKLDDLKALVSGMKSLPVICGSINSLQLDGNPLNYSQILILSEFPVNAVLHQTKSLNFNSCHLSQESIDHLAANIIPRTPHLQMLDIGCNNTEGKMTKLLSSLEDLPELQELNIEGTAFKFEDMVPLNKLLGITGSTLTHLSIGGKHMALESMNLLIDTVLTQSSIENLHISDLDLTRNSDTLTLLETNTTLKRLVFFECNVDISHLVTSLCMNTTLSELEIFFPLSYTERDIGPHATVALCDMLEVNRSLSELSLYSYKPLEEKKVTSLIETLTYNRTLEVLQLPHHFSKYFSRSELNTIDSRVFWRVWPCIDNL